MKEKETEGEEEDGTTHLVDAQATQLFFELLGTSTTRNCYTKKEVEP